MDDEYRQQLVSYYKENQIAFNKALLGLPAAALAFIGAFFKPSELSSCAKTSLTISAGLFALAVVTTLWGYWLGNRWIWRVLESKSEATFKLYFAQLKKRGKRINFISLMLTTLGLVALFSTVVLRINDKEAHCPTTEQHASAVT